MGSGQSYHCALGRNVRIYVPFTQLREATNIYLHSTALEPDMLDPAVLVDVSANRWAYTNHLQRAWRVGVSFINLEHDMVPWPGSLSAMWRCPAPWCFYSYIPSIHPGTCAPFGAVKFSAEIIAALPDVWDAMRKEYCDNPRAWAFNDIHFFRYAKNHGISAHQHWPSMFNANPAILENPPINLVVAEQL
jgi:hypothetical protein